MVSFLGLKFGSGKKKSDKGKSSEQERASEKTADKKPAQNGGPRKWDQNLLGEGQFFGTSVGSRTVVNGSIRSVNMSRPGTASSSRVSPYSHNTHALAASSMYDLSNISHIRQTSSNSLKPAASDTNLRGSFSNASATNLRVPGPGFGSRPGTPGGKTKAWVNPLDVHFGRATPSAVPSAPRSPLAQYEFGADHAGDGGSVFGDKAENIADTIMNSVVQKEQEKAGKEREQNGKVERERVEREAKQKAQEEETGREEERKMVQEKHKAAADAAAIRLPRHGPPGYPPGPNGANRPANGQSDRLIFQGRHDERPGSRNGRHDSPSPMDRSAFHGQDSHGPGSRNGSRPGPPGDQAAMGRGPFQGQMDYRPSSRNGHTDQRPRFQGHIDHQRPGSRNGSQDRAQFQGQMDPRPPSRNGPQDRPVFQGQMDQRPGSRNGPRRDGTPPFGHAPNGHANGYPNGHVNGRYMNGPSPSNGQSPMKGPGPMHGQARSPNIGHTGHINGHVNSARGRPLMEANGISNGAPPSPALNGPPRNGSPLNGLHRLNPVANNVHANANGYFPADLPSPTVSSSHSSSDEKEARVEPAGRPIIRNVIARRDTITSITPKRASISQAIDAFEKSLATEESVRDSIASSAYSADEIVESPVQPAMTPRPSPPYAAPSQLPRSGSAAGRPFPGKNVQRPSPDEYGVPLPTTGRTTPAAATVAPSPPARFESSSSPSPPSSQRLEHASLQPAPLFRQPKWDRGDEDFRHDDFSLPRPAPRSPPQPLPNEASSSSFLDFGSTPPTPGNAADPNWPLPSSSPPPPPPLTSSSPPSVSSPPQLSRSNPPPPPLDFDFSPNASTREQAHQFTPPPPQPPLLAPIVAGVSSRRSPSQENELRPSNAAACEVGVARGLSVRGPAHGLHTPTGIADRFGTPLI